MHQKLMAALMVGASVLAVTGCTSASAPAATAAPGAAGGGAAGGGATQAASGGGGGGGANLTFAKHGHVFTTTAYFGGGTPISKVEDADKALAQAALSHM